MKIIQIETNLQQYLNDIAEIIRGYLGFIEIQEAPFTTDAGYALRILKNDAGVIEIEGSKDAGARLAKASYQNAQNEERALLQKRFEKRAVKIAVFRAMQQLEPATLLPWGSLTGIRPTKLLRELIEHGGREYAAQSFLHEFDVTQQKYALASEIVSIQEKMLEGLLQKHVDIYIGIPFCRTRCLYCSFASDVLGRRSVPEAYMRALYKDISIGARLLKESGYKPRAFYIGGGTPTVLTAFELSALLAHIHANYNMEGLEFTVEAGRPDTLNREKLQILKDAGVTRISLNPQSMQDDTLLRIGRSHTKEDIVRIFHMARDLGFTNINMDVIAGLPGETAREMESTLEQIAALMPENLTVHTLAIKRSSPLKEKLAEYPLPSSKETEDMVALGERFARDMGMRPYYMYRQKYMRGNLENVGYAKENTECIYNVDMMEELVNILSHGAGAMTKRVYEGRDLRVERLPAPKDIATYIEKLDRLHAERSALYLG